MPTAVAEGENSGYIAALPDRVVAYESTRTASGGAIELTSLSVQRGGKTTTYSAPELITAHATHFVIEPMLPSDDPEAYARAPLLRPIRGPALGSDFEDRIQVGLGFASGLVNIGASRSALTEAPTETTPGLGIEFRTPVVNAPGPDLVVFDLQVLAQLKPVDVFRISPVEFSAGKKTYTVSDYDIDLSSKASQAIEQFRLLWMFRPLRSLDELRDIPEPRGRAHAVPARALAVGIDLSDLGFAPGESVRELFLQDALDDEGRVDPVIIVGLPADVPVHLADASAR